MRILRQHVVKTRKHRECRDCGRPICPGETALKVEMAERAEGARVESIFTEWSCCETHNARWVNWHNGPCVYRPRPSASQRILATYRVA
jgi:hypothetical protein